MSKSQGPNHDKDRQRLNRRTLFAGASTVGALAAVATVLPRAASETASAAPTARPAPERGGGYSLSEHVQHYYKTTRI
ncbi:MAG: formate dehydrogenase [Burkholderiaceae bacterium]